MVNYSYGVDIDSSFTFKDGDLVLSEYEDNLVQAIANRLNTHLDELNYFYINYGSLILDYLGWRKTEDTLKIIELELEECLKNEPRIGDYNIELEFMENGLLNIYVRLDNGEVLNFNVNNDGVQYGN